MSDMLWDDPPLVVNPLLAAAVGLNEAIVLQQLHYWLKRSQNVHAGHRWVYNTVSQWQDQFPFWSASTIKRVLADLKDRGLIAVTKDPARPMDRTNWYRIDYRQLQLVETAARGSRKVSRASGQVEPMVGSHRPDAAGQDEPVSKTETTQRTRQEKDAAAPLFSSSPDRLCPTTVGRKRVTQAECDCAWQVLDAFNEAAGTSLRAKGHVELIIRRMRERPEVTVEQHREVIRRFFAGPRWWDGQPGTNLIYGKDTTFEQRLAEAAGASAVHTSGSDVASGVHTPGKFAGRVRYED